MTELFMFAPEFKLRSDLFLQESVKDTVQAALRTGQGETDLTAARVGTAEQRHVFVQQGWEAAKRTPVNER